MKSKLSPVRITSFKPENKRMKSQLSPVRVGIGIHVDAGSENITAH
jgi:hypothetical protein